MLRLGQGRLGAPTAPGRTRRGDITISRRELRNRPVLGPSAGYLAVPFRIRADAITCGAVETIFSVTQVVISVIVIFLVLMHSGKDSGLSGAFGVGTGTGPLGGGSMVERNLNRWTIFFALLFVANTVLLLRHPWGGTG